MTLVAKGGLSIVLPIFNEKASVRRVVEAWHTDLTARNITHEFLFCEDGSTDGTKEVLIELSREVPSKNLSSLTRRGYGGGVQVGIANASYDYILCVDSDGQCMPDSIEQFLYLANQDGIVIGIRSPRQDPFVRKIYSGLFFALFSVLFGRVVRDPSCPYVLASSAVFRSLSPYLGLMREGFWWGFVGCAIRKGIPIAQVPIRHYPRIDGSTVVYKPSRMPGIIFRNIVGLFRVKAIDADRIT